jgi:dipeptidase D
MDVDTQKVLKNFHEISAIPRCSKKEQQIARHLEKWAHTHRFEFKKDPSGNLCIRVPGTSNQKTASIVVLQGHLDMVCVKTENADHDFTKDPIRLVYADDWITAAETTLGADNGIAVALAMAVAEDDTVQHPPLELLFTVDEESGLIGAKNLDPHLFEGRLLINLDSETEGVFTVGCAGGEETRIRLAVHPRAVPKGWRQYRIEVGGLHGGHSGIDIHKHRASANKILARILYEISVFSGMRLVDLTGGVTHNAIAREARAVFTCDPKQFDLMRPRITALQKHFQAEYPAESGLSVSSAEIPEPGSDDRALTAEETLTVAHLLMSLPHGVVRMSADIPTLVETSCNLAMLKTKTGVVEIVSSQRSSVMSRLSEITARIKSIAALAGAETENENAYPAWPPNMASPLLDRCKKVYRELFEKAPIVETIHAGLECGIIGAKRPGMDMISFGPTIENPHSPEERLHIPSVTQTWKFLTALLKSF